MNEGFDEDFVREYLGTFEYVEQDQYLHKLAEEYHTRCEDYDRRVCTGPIGRDGILPMTNQEMGAINRNALAVRKELQDRAYLEHGILSKEVSNAISSYRTK